MTVINFKNPKQEPYISAFEKIESRGADLLDSIIEGARQQYCNKHNVLLTKHIVEQATHKIWLEMSDILDYIFEEEYDDESYLESNHGYVYSIIKTRLDPYKIKVLNKLEESRKTNKKIGNTSGKK